MRDIFMLDCHRLCGCVCVRVRVRFWVREHVGRCVYVCVIVCLYGFVSIYLIMSELVSEWVREWCSFSLTCETVPLNNSHQHHNSRSTRVCVFSNFVVVPFTRMCAQRTLNGCQFFSLFPTKPIYSLLVGFGMNRLGKTSWDENFILLFDKCCV